MERPLEALGVFGEPQTVLIATVPRTLISQKRSQRNGTHPHRATGPPASLEDETQNAWDGWSFV